MSKELPEALRATLPWRPRETGMVTRKLPPIVLPVQVLPVPTSAPHPLKCSRVARASGPQMQPSQPLRNYTRFSRRQQSTFRSSRLITCHKSMYDHPTMPPRSMTGVAIRPRYHRIPKTPALFQHFNRYIDYTHWSPWLLSAQFQKLLVLHGTYLVFITRRHPNLLLTPGVARNQAKS